ncbi:MAG: HrpA-like RNA helicase [Motiliproteus sp.]|jgi:HrpA-like RNA helicase
MPLALPIDAIKQQVLELLPDRHLVVQAETGSGKSTRLPLWARQQGRVLVVEPRRVACLALAQYLAEQTATVLGKTVGYAIRFDSRFGPDSELVFVTPGIALRWLADNRLKDFDLVMLDEFHERRWDTDLLLALLLAEDRHRLVITSATLDAERLSAYLGGVNLQAGGRCFPVDMEHRAPDLREMPALQDLEKRIRQAVEAVWPRSDGDLLIFLPGRGEIQRCRAALASVDAELLELHGSVPAREQRRALESGKGRRIILATNIAETSLTIPGVRVVIDSGLERRTHQRNGRTVLGLHPISKASAEQRLGRAGRVAAGLCIRLWGEHAPLALSTPPEVLREELTEPVLAAACCGHPVQTLRFPDLLPEKSLGIAMEKLQRMNALDARGEATPYGRRLYPLPIDSLFAHLITAMPDDASRCATADLVAALGHSQRLLALPSSESGRRTLTDWQSKSCDATTLIALVRRDPPPPLAVALAVDNGALKEVRKLATQLRGALSLPAISQSPAYDHSRWLEALIGAAPELLFVRRKKRPEALGNGWAEVLVGRDSRFADDAEAALVFDQHSMPGKGAKQTINMATCMAPVSLKLIARLGVGETRMTQTSFKGGRLEVKVERSYAGRLIGSEVINPSGFLAREALADLILAGRLLAPAGARLKDDLLCWELYRSLENRELCGGSLPEPSVEPLPESQEWLVSKLQQLGVEEAEDIKLLELEDLAFEGVPEWEREEFDSLYPRQLSLGNLRLAVHYEPLKKRVTIEPIKGIRKTDPQRWELPGWSGWSVRYKKASRVVTIK